MPVLTSTYSAPLLFRSGYIQSVFADQYRKIRGVEYTRRRIRTHDEDFLDLDWIETGSKRLAILTHGLEGSSHSSYVLGMAKALSGSSWDVLAWNLRGCGGEPNEQLKLYHGGDSEDLQRVFSHALFKKRYSEIVLIGFDIGGNLTLKFLGEHGQALYTLIRRAVVFSVPCDLEAAAKELDKEKNQKFLRRYIDSLSQKVRIKERSFPGQIAVDKLGTIKTIEEFDNTYTAPLSGFKDAEEYWGQCSSDQYLAGIQVPTLVVNAKNDPLLSRECYPKKAAKENPYLFLEMPRSGGHLGFLRFGLDGRYWSEKRALAFLDEELDIPNNNK